MDRNRRKKTIDDIRSKANVPEAMKDFRFFLTLVFHRYVEGSPDPTKIQMEIADFMQHGGQFIAVLAMRGIGKTLIAAAFCVWCLYMDPEFQIGIVSKRREKAGEVTFFMRRIIEAMPELAHLRPQVEDRNSYIAFDVAGKKPTTQPSVVAMSIEGMLQGPHVDLVLADDVETEENSATDKGREKLIKRTADFVNMFKRRAKKVVSRVMFLGTPQHEESLYVTQLPKRGYRLQAWPMEFPDEDLRQHLGAWLAPSYLAAIEKDPSCVGKAADTRLNDEQMAIARAHSESNYRLQNLLDTRMTDDLLRPLKVRDFSVYPCGPTVDRVHAEITYGRSVELLARDLPTPGFSGDRFYLPYAVKGPMIPFEETVMVIDPSGRGTDETGFATGSGVPGRGFLRDSGGFRDGYAHETLHALAARAKLFRVNKILCEDTYGDGMFRAVFLPVLRGYFDREWMCSLEDLRDHVKMPPMNKERRIIAAVEPFLRQNKICVDPEVVHRDLAIAEGGGSSMESISYSLFRQLTRLTKTRGSLAHDDRLDAFAFLVAYWQRIASANTEQIAIERERAERERDLEQLKSSIENMKRGVGPQVRLRDTTNAFEAIDIKLPPGLIDESTPLPEELSEISQRSPLDDPYQLF